MYRVLGLTYLMAFVRSIRRYSNEKTFFSQVLIFQRLRQNYIRIIIHLFNFIVQKSVSQILSFPWPSFSLRGNSARPRKPSFLHQSFSPTRLYITTHLFFAGDFMCCSTSS